MLKRNLKNSIYTVTGKVVSSLVLLVILARILDKEEFGAFTYALAFATILGLVVDYGFNIKLLKDISQNPGSLKRIITTAAALKALIAGVIISISLFLSVIPSLTPHQHHIIIVLTISYIFYSFGNMFLAPFKCADRYDIEARYVIIDSVLLLILCSGTAFYMKDALPVAAGYMASKALFVTLTAIHYRRVYGLEAIGLSDIISELNLAFPFAVHLFVGNIYLNLDTVVIKEYVSLSEVAVYQAGMRIVIGSSMVLTVLNSVLTPRWSRLRETDRGGFQKEILRALAILAGMGLAAFLVLWLGADQVVNLVFGAKYVDLTGLLWIFGLIIFLRYWGAIYGLVLTVSERQAVRSTGGFITLLLIIVSDLFILPVYGIFGAAVVMLVAHIVLNLIYIIFVGRDYPALVLMRSQK